MKVTLLDATCHYLTPGQITADTGTLFSDWDDFDPIYLAIFVNMFSTLGAIPSGHSASEYEYVRARSSEPRATDNVSFWYCSGDLRSRWPSASQNDSCKSENCHRQMRSLHTILRQRCYSNGIQQSYCGARNISGFRRIDCCRTLDSSQSTWPATTIFHYLRMILS